ncbi:TIM-barrel domain-containing protein [Chitinophaga sp. GbtcB8]|uniref:glycoside hydrolase family 31 protein n=1 Tax=Chitinophaga sp. GbtcB8 TaxID=2824753 RepID=UPI001C2F82A6|nr:TIM-barrel domain-containing protein [Chitinophaga sp. GbtcB8]
MINRIVSLVSCLFLFLGEVQSQVFKEKDNGIEVVVKDVHVEINFFSPAIVRVVKFPAGATVIKKSLSVIKMPENIRPVVLQKGDTLFLRTDSVVVSVVLNTGRICFSNTQGGKLFSEKDYGVQFTPVKDANKPSFIVRQAFVLDNDEAIYGLGQQQNGKMSQRGQRVYLRQDNMKVCIPFFQSVKGYGVFWDNYSPTTFTDNLQETSFDSEAGDCADYYFLYGGNAEGVVAQMRGLTGQAPLMPLWVYGFNQSRERYKTQYELVDVVRQYRSLKVPLDGIVQDWQYWGRDSNWNAMSFDPNTFPDPKGMVDSVHQLHAHLFIVAWPGFGPLTKQYEELKQKNMLIHFETWPPASGTTPYDVYNPQARDIYWRYLNKGIFSLNTDAWWLDSSEPDHVNLKERDFDKPTYLGSFRSVRNAFPLQHVGGVYDHQRQTTDKKRVSILTRSAFAGQQRYAANTWSGDVGSNWETLTKQIPAALNFSLCGIPYWNADIGGFFAGSFVKGGGARNPAFQELYTRWMQFATFTPMMRSHGTDIPREIYQFGNRGEWAFDVQEKFINLRYQLLPYLYSTAWGVTSKAGSIMRSLAMDFASDKKVWDIGNEYMFGQSFLVAPVTESHAQNRSVYLPAGTLWYNFWDGGPIAGGVSIAQAAPIDRIPLFVKAGSIIPWGPKVQYAAEKKWDNLELRIYPGADATFTLYEDEGDGYDYEKGSYSEIHFQWNDQTRILSIDDVKGSFPGMLNDRKFNIVVVDTHHGVGMEPSGKFNTTVRYKGKRLTVRL